MNFGFSGEMIFLFLLALILFGPKKMPEIGRQVARLLNEFRRASNEFRSQIESEVNSLDGGGNAGANRLMLPSLQAPLGSLANRIFNPPSPEKLEAVEEANAEAAAVKAAAAESVAAKAEADPSAAVDGQDSVSTAAEFSVARTAAPKVAPDA
jgi:Sec-independent protein translocase protein TatA